MKITIQFILLFLLVNLSWGQQQDVVLPSPETAALFRYQDYPMDYSTGLPQISIPLFTVQNRSLSVPVSISYHASGFRVSDVDGPIGVGWSLNVGGMVSRTIHGDPDFGDKPFPVPFDPYLGTPGQDVLEILSRVAHSPYNPDLVATDVDWLDAEYDMFSYSFGNHSGKFIFKDENGAKTPVFLNEKPLKIYPITDSSGLNSLRITSDSGDNYTFVGQEYQTTNVFNYTGFAVKSIVSANLKDTISYTYGGVAQQYRRYISQDHIVKDVWDSDDTNQDVIPDDIERLGAQYYNISRITEIDFEQGTLQFILKGGNGQDNDLIDNIQLRDRNGNLIRKVKFNRDPLHRIRAVLGTTDLQTHKLTSIEIQDKNENTIESYAFEHYPTVFAGQDSANEIIDTRFIDYWGYYNASGDTFMVPRSTVPYQQTDISPSQDINVGNPNINNRKPSFAAIKSGVVKKVHYPTGGNTEFIYEMNRYNDSETGIPQDGPGLRVQQMINSDGSGSTVKRYFKYSTLPETFTDYGEIDLEPKDEFMYTQHRYEAFGQNVGRHRERIFHSDFIPSLSELASRPIRYTYVTEYKGDLSDNTGKTLYNYDNFRWAYTKGILPNGQGGSYNKWHINQYRYWDTPMLQDQTDFRAIKNGATTTYQEIRKISNTYAALEASSIQALHVQRNYTFSGAFQVATPSRYFEEYCYRVLGFPVYAYGPYNISIGTKNLTSSTETITHDDGTIVSTNTSYKYNAENYVKEINTVSSRIDGTNTQGSILKKEILYAADTNGGLFDQMVNLNMLQYKTEEKDQFDGQPTNTTKINYIDWDNDTDPLKAVIRPISTEVAKGNDALEPRTSYHSYDSKGNPQEISQENGPHTYYIWGYHDTKPIAKIDNFTQTQANTIQTLITAAKSASDADNGMAGKEDDLRDALKDIRDHSALGSSMITTYTYDPLVGATSMTDPRGYTIFYEYDTFNRLEVVRDATGNIVSDYEYSYMQPTSN